MHTEPTPPSARLVFLDWVRILAFFILVLYHVGMYYVSWDWHIKSEFAGSALAPFLVLSAPWRLGLLFLVLVELLTHPGGVSPRWQAETPHAAMTKARRVRCPAALIRI